MNIEKKKNPKEKVISLLDLITPKKWSIDYAITLTLKPHCYSNSSDVQLSKTKIDIYKMFKDCEFTIIAEHTKQYNIHYHGIVKYPFTKHDGGKYLYDCIRKFKDFGFAVVKPITEFEIWSTYIQKDIVDVVEDDYGIIKIIDSSRDVGVSKDE